MVGINRKSNSKRWIRNPNLADITHKIEEHWHLLIVWFFYLNWFFLKYFQIGQVGAFACVCKTKTNCFDMFVCLFLLSPFHLIQSEKLIMYIIMLYVIAEVTTIKWSVMLRKIAYVPNFMTKIILKSKLVGQHPQNQNIITLSFK